MAFSPSEQRRQRQRDEARRAILDAAEALLAEEGAEGLSMRRLAARSGYALPTLYHHFGDKRRLVEAVLDDMFRQVAELLRAAARPDPVACMRAMLGAWVAFGLENPAHYQLFVATLQEGDEPPATDEVRSLLEAPLAELLGAGRLRAPDVEVVLQAIWTFCHGLISLRTSRADVDWASDLVDVAVDGMLLGLVCDASAASAEREA
jgi:AcrR family transcriptional regulator